MNHGLTTTGAALLDRISQGIQKHPKRITALLAALLLTGGGGAFAVASLLALLALVTLALKTLIEFQNKQHQKQRGLE